MNAPAKTSQQLIEENQGLVRSLAGKIHRKLPPHVDLEDLVAYGQVGLAEAARDFDPARGSRFSTYAYYRIRGAVYDGLSKMTWFSRSEYKRIRYQQMANETLKAEPSQPQSGQEKGLGEELHWFRDISRALAVVYLATQCESPEGATSRALEDPSAPDPTAQVISEEITRKLHELIESLPPEAGQLIRTTYFEGCTLQEAGRRLGISKSWASRLHAKALRSLARSLKMVGAAS